MTIGPHAPDIQQPLARRTPDDQRPLAHAHSPTGMGVFSMLLDGLKREASAEQRPEQDPRSELKSPRKDRDEQTQVTRDDGSPQHADAAATAGLANPIGHESRQALRTPTDRPRPEHDAGAPPHQRGPQRSTQGSQPEPSQQRPSHEPQQAEPARPASDAREQAQRTPGADTSRDQIAHRAAAQASARPTQLDRAATADHRSAAVSRIASAGGVAGAPRAQAVQPAVGVQRSEARAEPRQVAQQRQAQQHRQADTEKFVQQAQRGLAQALQRKDGEVTMRLHPEALGKLTVQVRVEASSVHARVQATTEAAKEMLMSHTPALRAALESRGLEVQRIEITLAPEAKDESGPRFAMSDEADRRAGGHAGNQADQDGGRGSDAGSKSGRSPNDGAEDRAEQAHTSAAWRSPGSLLIDTVA